MTATQADYWLAQGGKFRVARKPGKCLNRYRAHPEDQALTHCQNRWDAGDRYLDTGAYDDYSPSPYATLRYCAECAART